MLKTVAETPQYKLEVNLLKNRAYLTIIGFWRGRDEVSTYLDDWSKALTSLKPGFTLLTDTRSMKIHPADVRALHERAQQMVTEAGVKAVAEIQENGAAKLQLESLSQETKMPKNSFDSGELAEEWLDNQ
ncbi:hypothetical protein AB9P05_05165 [Roseivirga sp. BDSF3-8]|uniref:hypothetical protein n=1 Tax=Roseivirga sp. BDSF3-8 TaxID=3241598 RepID=UPI0035321091